jgi:hypothetical protein
MAYEIQSIVGLVCRDMWEASSAGSRLTYFLKAVIEIQRFHALTLALSGAQQATRSGLLLLLVRDERNVRNH